MSGTGSEQGSSWRRGHRAAADCSRRLRVLADTTRLHILRSLGEGPLHVGEIARFVAVEQSLLSHHLRVLRDARLVHAVRDGKAVLYRLADGVRPPAEHGDVLDLGCCCLRFDRDSSV